MLFHKCKRIDETVCNQERADYLEKSNLQDYVQRYVILLTGLKFNSKYIIFLRSGLYVLITIYIMSARPSFYNDFNSRYNYHIYVLNICSTFAWSIIKPVAV